MSVCAQFAPYRLAHARAWSSAKSDLLSSVLRTLDRYAPGIEARVERSQVLSPVDFEDAYGLTGGQIHHGELSPDQLFTMRPVLGWARYRTPIPGLFLCGAGTHPGGGITGGSGQNAARAILADLKS
jgi:phytoene dehydrogenase-like protein